MGQHKYQIENEASAWMWDHSNNVSPFTFHNNMTSNLWQCAQISARFDVCRLCTIMIDFNKTYIKKNLKNVSCGRKYVMCPTGIYQVSREMVLLPQAPLALNKTACTHQW